MESQRQVAWSIFEKNYVDMDQQGEQQANSKIICRI